MELSNLDERNLWGWLSSNSRLAHLRPLLAGLDGAALVGATVTELGELGIAAIHARLLLRAIEEEFGPSALAAAGSSTTPISAPSRRSSVPSALAAARWSSPFFLQSGPSQPNESFRRIWCHHGAGALWRS